MFFTMLLALIDLQCFLDTIMLAMMARMMSAEVSSNATVRLPAHQ
jgi:hypothetical protein